MSDASINREEYANRPVSRGYCEVMLHDSSEIVQRIARAYLELLDKNRWQPTTEQIKYMRDRFLNWTLPKDLNPDGGISFKRSESAIKYNHPMPVGTNFLDAVQAEEMVRYMIDGLGERRRYRQDWSREHLPAIAWTE